MRLHALIESGDLEGLTKAVQDHDCLGEIDEIVDDLTPLARAAQRREHGVEFMDILVKAGAKLNITCSDLGATPLSTAIKSSVLENVKWLVDQGANLLYRTESGYDAVIDAAYGKGTDQEIADLIEYLVHRGVSVHGQTSYGETGALTALGRGNLQSLSTLCRLGVQDDELGLTPLSRAIIFGTLDEFDEALESSPQYLETPDTRGNRPWHLALMSGDRAKAERLMAQGCDIHVKTKRGDSPLNIVIAAGQLFLVEWLIDLGIGLEQRSEYGATALMTAADEGHVGLVQRLLELGADPNAKSEMVDSVLECASDQAVALALIEGGARPLKLPQSVHRVILGYPEEPTLEYERVSKSDYHRAKHPRFGQGNPELVNEPFWVAMIRSGVNGYVAHQFFDSGHDYDSPVWSADRFGQSLTRLPDGRMIQIGGEHEDFYDEDFCIYNDVFIHDGEGGVEIAIYPEEDFSPTDFHTATLVGDEIIVIGGLGYFGERHHGKTPVYRFCTQTYRMTEVKTTGKNPGWIFEHRATLLESGELLVEGGTVVRRRTLGGKEKHVANKREYVLDLDRLSWIRRN